MKEENSHKLPNGLVLSCLCGVHTPDSKCSVYLRNNGRVIEAEELEKAKIADYFPTDPSEDNVCISCQ